MSPARGRTRVLHQEGTRLPVAERLGFTPLRSTSVHVAGTALCILAAGMAVSAVIEQATGGEDTGALLGAVAVTATVGVLARFGTTLGPLTRASAFAPVGMTWLAATLFGALPYVLARTFSRPGITWPVELVDAVFESASGFSCAGSTVFGADGNFIEDHGRGILFWRQSTQWFGGMGIVLLVVAVLPALGVGGIGLVGAEAPGETSDRLVPRISETAKRLWLLYLGLTALIATALFAVPGPSLYDSVSLAFAAAATAGFAPYDTSVGRWDSAAVEAILVAGLLLGATNFTLHWRALVRGPGAYARDSEFRAYIGTFAAGIAVVAGLLWWKDGFGAGTAVRYATFNVVSMGSTAGFGNATGTGSPGDFVTWTPAAQLVLLLFMLSGGMTGSTSGAIKVKRVQIGARHARRSMHLVRRPNAVLPLRLGREAQPEWVVSRVAGFVALYATFVVGGTLVVAALGAGLDTAIGGTISAMGNVGPGIGAAGPTASFADAFTAPARLVLALLMIVGRLEIIPMLLLLATPARVVRSAVRRSAARRRRARLSPEA